MWLITYIYYIYHLRSSVCSSILGSYYFAIPWRFADEILQCARGINPDVHQNSGCYELDSPHYTFFWLNLVHSSGLSVCWMPFCVRWMMPCQNCTILKMKGFQYFSKSALYVPPFWDAHFKQKQYFYRKFA